KLELRAITVRPAIFDRSVIMSSLMPSEKYSCSGSPDMLVNGKTAIDAVATLGKGLSILDLVASDVARGCHFQIRIGRLIFLTVMSPASWKRTSIRFRRMAAQSEAIRRSPTDTNTSPS